MLRQQLPYYLDYIGTPAKPGVKNDFENALVIKFFLALPMMQQSVS